MSASILHRAFSNTYLTPLLRPWAPGVNRLTMSLRSTGCLFQLSFHLASRSLLLSKYLIHHGAGDVVADELRELSEYRCLLSDICHMSFPAAPCRMPS